MIARGSSFGLRAIVLGACITTVVGCGCSGGTAATEPPPIQVPTMQAATVPPDLGARSLEHVRALVGFGARHAGSPGWQRSVDYIAAQLEAMGIATTRDRWTDERESMTFENLFATIPGRAADRIVLGAHHDTKITSGHSDPSHNFPFVGANDSGSGVGLLLEIARYLTEHSPAATVELVFFDGEESVPFKWEPTRSLFGSRRFVERELAAVKRDPKRPRIRAMILLDMVGATDLGIDDETASDRRLHAIFRAAAKACGQEAVFFRRSHSVTDDHVPFMDEGIPSIDLIDLYDNPEWHTANDTVDRMSATSLQTVGHVVLTALPVVAERFVTATTR